MYHLFLFHFFDLTSLAGYDAGSASKYLHCTQFETKVSRYRDLGLPPIGPRGHSQGTWHFRAMTCMTFVTPASVH